MRERLSSRRNTISKTSFSLVPEERACQHNLTIWVSPAFQIQPLENLPSDLSWRYDCLVMPVGV